MRNEQKRALYIKGLHGKFRALPALNIRLALIKAHITALELFFRCINCVITSEKKIIQGLNTIVQIVQCSHRNHSTKARWHMVAVTPYITKILTPLFFKSINCKSYHYTDRNQDGNAHSHTIKTEMYALTARC